MERALEKIKVIDISQVAAVPMAARHLADFGAEVLHIENPVSGDPWRNHQSGVPGGYYGPPSRVKYEWENFNRNKKSVTVDISTKDGQEVIYNLVKRADVFLSNLRPYEIEKYKLGYATLNDINPMIIYGNITGFGKNGPDKNSPAFDVTAYLFRSGMGHVLSSITEMPVGAIASSFGDSVAGLFLAFGVIIALHERDKKGKGQQVDVSLLHAGMYQIAVELAGCLNTGMDFMDYKSQTPTAIQNEINNASERLLEYQKSITTNPLTAKYTTKDGRIIKMAAVINPDRYWPTFCHALGITELENDQRFNSINNRKNNALLLYEILNKVFLSRTLEEWKPRLQGLPYAPLQNLKEVIEDPQTLANNCFIDYEHPGYGKVKGLTNPVKLSRTPADIRMPAPEFGEHTEEVLLENGYTWEDIALLKEKRVIA